MHRLRTTAVVAALVLAGAHGLMSHCQIPCGIYGDSTRFDLLREHADTIEKSMTQITELSKEPAENANQLVRWVSNKEVHADELTDIVTFYFLAQRVKPVPKTDEAAHDKYVAQLEMLHRMMVAAMKSKQTTDVQHVTELRRLIHDFEVLYTGKHDHQH